MLSKTTLILTHPRSFHLLRYGSSKLPTASRSITSHVLFRTKLFPPGTIQTYTSNSRKIPLLMQYQTSYFQQNRIIRSPLSYNLGSLSYFSSSNRTPRGGSRWMQGAAGLVGAGSILLGKGKYLIGALKLTKFASLGSMILSIGTYSMFFGLPYAVGMVGLLLVHETGHVLVMMNRGIPYSPMVFMPFVGAVVAMNRRPRDAWEDALVALGGPMLGSVGAGAVALAAQGTQSQLLFALADFGFMINLFNLLPIGSLDGGRVASALSPYAGVAGLGLGGYMAYSGVVQNPIFYLVLLAGGYETFQRFYDPHHLPPKYYKITNVQRSVITASYFGLIAALLAGMSANQIYKKSPEVLIRERELEKQWDMR